MGIPTGIYAFHRYTVILLSSPEVKSISIQRRDEVEPHALTSDLIDRLRALYAQ